MWASYLIFVNIFSHLVSLSFYLLDGVLLCTKSYNFRCPIYFSFPLLVSYLENHCWDPRSRRFPPLFSRSFVVLALAFRQLIHLEFIFTFCEVGVPKIIPLQVDILLSQHHFLKKTIFVLSQCKLKHSPISPPARPLPLVTTNLLCLSELWFLCVYLLHSTYRRSYRICLSLTDFT